MRDTVTADGKGFDQDSGRAGNANAPAGRTTAIEEQHLDTKSAPPTLLQGLSEEEVRLRRARGQGNTVKLPTSRSYGQILRENIVTLINLILFALSGVLILLGRPLDAITTVAVISFNLVVGDRPGDPREASARPHRPARASHRHRAKGGQQANGRSERPGRWGSARSATRRPDRG